MKYRFDIDKVKKDARVNGTKIFLSINSYLVGSYYSLRFADNAGCPMPITCVMTGAVLSHLYDFLNENRDESDSFKTTYSRSTSKQEYISCQSHENKKVIYVRDVSSVDRCYTFSYAEAGAIYYALKDAAILVEPESETKADQAYVQTLVDFVKALRKVDEKTFDSFLKRLSE